MKERPILFSAPMVRALLDGSKTQTRRVVKLTDAKGRWDETGYQSVTDSGIVKVEWNASRIRQIILCPHGQPGDRLWVRENFRGCRAYEVQGYAPKDWGNKPIWFEADGTPPGKPEAWALRSRPSIHMPRWASRITLEITGVRVERLQDISADDAFNEGIKINVDAETKTPLVRVTGKYPPTQYIDGFGLAIAEYASLWESINGPGSWATNPWVWVIEFKVIK